MKGDIEPHSSYERSDTRWTFGDPKSFFKTIRITAGIMTLACFIGVITRVTDVVAGYRDSIWPSVPGTIIECRDVAHDGSGAKWPEISYRYAIDSKTYTGTEVVIGLQGDPDVTKSLVARFPDGANVPVYYNPENPLDSVLIRGTTPERKYGIAICLAAMCLFFATTWKPELISWTSFRRRARNFDDDDVSR